MRIDTTVLPQVPGLATLQAQAGPAQPFEDLISSPQTAGGDGDTKAAPVLSQYVFGFDTLGILGLGGPAGVGKPFEAGAGVGNAVSPHPLHPERDALPTPAIRPHVSIPYAAFSPSPRIEAPVAVAAEATPESQAARTVLLGAGLSPGTPRAVSMGQSAPMPAAQARIVGTVSLATAMPRPGLSAVQSAGGDTRAAQPSAKARTAFRFEPARTGGGQFSVTVSEGEDLLHIVAAAPGLGESERQMLKTVADEAAAEAGIILGELRLNGAVVRHLPKTT